MENKGPREKVVEIVMDLLKKMADMDVDDVLTILSSVLDNWAEMKGEDPVRMASRVYKGAVLAQVAKGKLPEITFATVKLKRPAPEEDIDLGDLDIY